MAEQQNWDVEEVYDTQIAPLMERIIAICKQHQMPMLASFNIALNDSSARMCTTALHFEDVRGEYRYARALQDIRRPSAPSFAAFTIRGGGNG